MQLPDMFYHEEGYFIMKFKSMKDSEDVMMKGLYSIRNLPMVLLEWRPDFSMERDMLRSVPIWVKLPNLPVQMWGDSSLGKIGSVIGTPLYTDECTTEKLMVSYARILVEVDVTQKLHDEIVINFEGEERNQKVEYEWRPKYCEVCQKVGHVCRKEKKPTVKMWQQKFGQEQGEAKMEENYVADIVLDKQKSPEMQVNIVKKMEYGLLF